jgi:hypothetical protein
MKCINKICDVLSTKPDSYNFSFGLSVGVSTSVGIPLQTILIRNTFTPRTISINRNFEIKIGNACGLLNTLSPFPVASSFEIYLLVNNVEVTGSRILINNSITQNGVVINQNFSTNDVLSCECILFGSSLTSSGVINYNVFIKNR